MFRSMLAMALVGCTPEVVDEVLDTDEVPDTLVDTDPHGDSDDTDGHHDTDGHPMDTDDTDPAMDWMAAACSEVGQGGMPVTGAPDQGTAPAVMLNMAATVTLDPSGTTYVALSNDTHRDMLFFFGAASAGVTLWDDANVLFADLSGGMPVMGCATAVPAHKQVHVHPGDYTIELAGTGDVWLWVVDVAGEGHTGHGG